MMRSFSMRTTTLQQQQQLPAARKAIVSAPRAAAARPIPSRRALSLPPPRAVDPDQSGSAAGAAATTAAAAAAAPAGGEVYAGAFGPWRITKGDEIEVACYRAGLTATAVAIVGSAAIGLGGGIDAASSTATAAATALDALCVVGAAGLGVSVALIHVYVTPLKRALQALWAAGVAGGLYLAATHGGAGGDESSAAAAVEAATSSLPAFVAAHPWAVWLVGPYFASLAGVAVKEGICYGKPEAAALAALLPLALLGHLTGLAPAPVEGALVAAAAGATAVFAARKWTQPVKDDIGDGSVFNFRKLPPAEQERALARLRQQQQGWAAQDGGGSD